MNSVSRKKISPASAGSYSKRVRDRQFAIAEQGGPVLGDDVEVNGVGFVRAQEGPRGPGRLITGFPPTNLIWRATVATCSRNPGRRGKLVTVLAK